MIPKVLKLDVEKKLSEQLGKEAVISDSFHISGGCINDSCKLISNIGEFFIKWNDKNAFPGMFEEEEIGLRALLQVKCMTIPKVILQSETGSISYLVLEFVEKGSKRNDFWSEFGRSLACIHRNRNDKFGWDSNNYIGSLPQYNRWSESWTDFFVEMRIQKQMQLAFDKGLLDSSDFKNAESLFMKLEELIPQEQASLIHGDLWSGNFITDGRGGACILDPAVYYGNREMDIAMSYLFGGFDQEFYDAYFDSFPVETGIKERIDIYNLYPLLVHLNLFGMSYRSAIRSTLKKWS